MASQIFNFPGFFDREIDLTQQIQEPVGVPAGVIGGAERGPAFVPRTVGSFSDFKTRFGDLNPRYAAPYAVDKFLENRTALTFIRILGAGSNETSADIENTRNLGIVKNAGFELFPSSSAEIDSKANGGVQFIVARHFVSSSEAFAMPMFSDNNSYGVPETVTGSSDGDVYLTRGVIFTAHDTRIQIMDHDEFYTNGTTGPLDDVASVTSASVLVKEFKIAISSSAGSSFGNDEDNPGVRILTASLDPSSDNYFAKLMNTDPEKFEEEKHVVYADYAVDAELASVVTGSPSVAIASGSANWSDNVSTGSMSQIPWLEAFGRFDTRYTTPKTSWFISQPYGKTEYDLFYVEGIDDGEYANQRYKISITNVLKSSNVKDKHGSFSLVVRAFDDTDVEPKILEQFNNLSLDPNSDNYIAKVIGDKKAVFNFDVESEEDRRLLSTGKFANRSRFVRVIVSDQVAQGKIPEDAVPFGFRGIEALNTNALLTDNSGDSSIQRLAVSGAGDVGASRLEWSIIPPLPFRFKVTRGNASTSPGFEGAPGDTELADGRYYWGIKFTRNSNALNPNIVNLPNKLINSYTKFAGISKLDTLVTGSGIDDFNSNKFSLSRVALGNGSISDVTSSANIHMKEAAYLRDRVPDGFEYKVTDRASGNDRITFATLYQKGSTAADFNKFSNFAKFTNIMYGGFDGVNILDKNAATFNDRSTSTDSRGLAPNDEQGNAAASFVSPGFRTQNVNGFGTANSTVNSYRVASEIITDTIASNINILAIPGQRDALVTNYAADQTRDFNLAFYAMDVPAFDSNGDRIWDNESSKFVDVEQTANTFEQRALDNEFAGAYFPDFIIDDNVNRRRITVPASVGAVAALGFNDRVAYPWFAPAGFNRGALDFVRLPKTRIKQPERERLYDIHINPIVKFPGEDGYVIFAQNTLEQAESALGSINVIRMMNELKRRIVEIGNRALWEQIVPETYTELDRKFRNVLNVITARAGIERFDVIVDARNNTNLDRENNKVNARIVLVPTRAVEFITIDFIITRSGVSFETL